MALKAVAVPLDVDDPAMMQQPVEDGRGDHRVTEEFLPIREAFV